MTANILVYGIGHGIIDAACVAVVFSNFQGMQSDLDYFSFLVILYGVLAFSLQVPFGLMVDRFRIPVAAAIAGCVVTLIAVVSFQLPVVSILSAGIGNALFHVGGGVVSLNLIRGRASMPGIFVAPGALGLLAGTLIGQGGHFVVWPFSVSLFLTILAVLSIERPEIDYDTKNHCHFSFFEFIVPLLLVSVAIRSVVGLAVDFPWKSDFYLLVCLTLAVVSGKALGGIWADRFGWTKVSVVGLMIAAPLVSFGVEYPLLSIMGIFMLNLSMPVTLTALANMLPGMSGFAFGLTTLALITGALPAFTEFRFLFSHSWVVLTTFLLSGSALCLALTLYFRRGNCVEGTK